MLVRTRSATAAATAHRTSTTAAFRHLPTLVAGDVAHVDAGGVRYTYRVTATRETSFRSPASLTNSAQPCRAVLAPRRPRR